MQNWATERLLSGCTQKRQDVNFKSGVLILSVSLETVGNYLVQLKEVRVNLNHDVGHGVYGRLASSACLTEHHDGGGVWERKQREYRSQPGIIHSQGTLTVTHFLQRSYTT